MSYSNGLQLLRLADLAAARHLGVTLEDVCEEFGCSPRTAQRMMRALEDAFPNAVTIMASDDRRRRWRVHEVPIARLRLQGSGELEPLEAAIDAMQDRGDVRHGDALAGLRDRLLAALPPQAARAAETDADALLEAYGMAARPGPVVTTDRNLAEAIAHTLRGPWRMRFSYNGEARIVEPYAHATRLDLEHLYGRCPDPRQRLPGDARPHDGRAERRLGHPDVSGGGGIMMQRASNSRGVLSGPQRLALFVCLPYGRT